jgi:hypothetical protein
VAPRDLQLEVYPLAGKAQMSAILCAKEQHADDTSVANEQIKTMELQVGQMSV